MIHGHFFLTRRRDRAPPAFSAYWRGVHADLVKRVPGLRKYVQSLRVQTPQDDVFARILSDYDGVDEFWLDDVAAVLQVIREPSFINLALPDAEAVIDPARLEVFCGTDHVMLDGTPPPGAVKGVWMLKRREDMTLEAYRRHWLGPHADCIRALPGVRRYVQCHALLESYALAWPRWDGIVHIWFDNIAAMHHAFTCAAGDAAVEDGPRLFDMDGMRFFHAVENPVFHTG